MDHGNKEHISEVFILNRGKHVSLQMCVLHRSVTLYSLGYQEVLKYNLTQIMN